MVFGGLAASLSTLTDTEKELGVALVDIGGGTCDLCLFVEGSLAHSVVLPIGGKNITNDLAIGLRSSLDTAEKIKLELSRINKKKETAYESEEEKKEKKDDTLDISKLSLTEDVGQLSKKTLVDGIIKPRLTEIFTLIGMEIKRAGFSGLLPSGLVITGGAAETVGMAEVGKEVLRMPVRIASPQGVVGLIDEISDPAYGAGTGLLLYGQTVSAPSGISIPSLPGLNLKGFFGKIISWLRGFLP
ncbi:MAG: hypothetical protein A2Y57_03145 [Candidatus Woykebacteria bacterium RBG_13_40_7b]|uniref:Cell division protein FtsA n=1 Tax=Candidatus Woykebacteria bacterium RBG_13_40_7b TaxID=1802594 RepID=A0A1G1W963_9BACT|nr:MAG: hypothetical protein A2Y57_03145 [Candidatus Woykebacteria bacterium RBG_13_40_7b]